MQVFVKINDQSSIIIEVTLQSKVRELVALAFNKKFPDTQIPQDERIKVRYQNRALQLDVTLQEYNLQKDTTFSVYILPSQNSMIDREVENGLHKFLHVTATEANSNEITFIGVGSYDNGHADIESIQRQQCPLTLLNYCLDNRVDLNIILIDPGFGTEASHPPQIYHSGDWALLHKELNGKIRQYKHQPAVTRGACDIWLTTFATGIAEYRADLLKQGTVIANIDLPNLFSIISKLQNACLICGNFYASPTEDSQFFTLGDEQLIMAAGFKVNPPH